MDSSWIWWYSLLPLLILIASALKLRPTRKKLKLPPSPSPWLPLIGHLYFLKFPIHRTFRDLSGKLGSPIFSLRLGARRLVVISSPALVGECFVKNDVVLASRPRSLIGEYLSYNYTTLVAASYGDHWRNLRRLTTTEVFSFARLAAFQWMREDEARILLGRICRKSREGFAKIELRPLLSDLTFNNIMRMLSGKRYFGKEEDYGGDSEAREFQGLIKEVFSLGGVIPSDFLPILRWIDYGGVEKRLRTIGEKMDAFLQVLIDEERRRNNGGNTMISHLLSLQDSDEEYYTDTIIKGIIMVMLIAGPDTSSVTIEWAMSALLNHLDKLELARAEIVDVVGVDRLMNESDIPKLHYLQNIISDVLRLFPAAPLLAPHEASDDCKVGGYDIPRDTMVLANAWAIHRDPAIWDEPTVFWPERFEGGEAGAGTTRLLPFGIGRRSCPGNGLANRTVGLVLGSLIQCFEWRRLGEELVDMAEGRGVSMPKAVPLEAFCKPRDDLRWVLSAI